VKEDYRNIFSKRLQYYMSLNNLTQSDLCSKLGFTKSAVSTWVLGTRIPRPEVIDSLADFFGIKRSDLLEYKQEGDNNSLSIESQQILHSYNNNLKIKILFDKAIKLSDQDINVLISMANRMNGSNSNN